MNLCTKHITKNSQSKYSSLLLFTQQQQIMNILIGCSLLCVLCTGSLILSWWVPLNSVPKLILKALKWAANLILNLKPFKILKPYGDPCFELGLTSNLSTVFSSPKRCRPASSVTCSSPISSPLSRSSSKMS